MLSITPTMSATFFELSSMPRIVSTTRVTTSPPERDAMQFADRPPHDYV